MQGERLPFGLTVVIAAITFMGVLSIIVGLNMVRILSLTSLPPQGSSGATGAALLIVGILDLLVAAGIATRRLWAYVLTLIVLGMTVFAGIFALVQHGVNTENAPNLVPAIIASIVVAYLLNERVRPLFEG